MAIYTTEITLCCSLQYKTNSQGSCAVAEDRDRRAVTVVERLRMTPENNGQGNSHCLDGRRQPVAELTTTNSWRHVPQHREKPSKRTLP